MPIWMTLAVTLLKVAGFIAFMLIVGETPGSLDYADRSVWDRVNCLP